MPSTSSLYILTGKTQAELSQAFKDLAHESAVDNFVSSSNPSYSSPGEWYTSLRPSSTSSECVAVCNPLSECDDWLETEGPMRNQRSEQSLSRSRILTSSEASCREKSCHLKRQMMNSQLPRQVKEQIPRNDESDSPMPACICLEENIKRGRDTDIITENISSFERNIAGSTPVIHDVVSFQFCMEMKRADIEKKKRQAQDYLLAVAMIKNRTRRKENKDGKSS